MPLLITDLRPGDRVILNCPKSRVSTHREAIFEGVFTSVADAALRSGVTATLISSPTAEFLAGGAWARFLMQTVGGVELVGAFAVDPDGSLREEQGRRIYIERRVSMGQG